MRTQKLREMLDDNEGVLISSFPNIFYYSGFRSEDAYLLISHDEQYIITDSRYTIQAKEQAADFELWDISKGLEKVIEKSGVKRLGFEEENLSVGKMQRIREKIPSDIELVKMQKRISDPRRIKDEEEIRRIAEAERLGDEAFLHILEHIRPGKTEREIALELEFFMKKNGASALSFDTIAASGVRSAMPHGIATDKPVENGDFLTLDFGCVLDGYCSDMTRTVGVGAVSPKLCDIYNIVLKAQCAALDFIAAGEKCSDADAAARKIIEDAGWGECFGHSLGHSVGIEIHEAPNFSPKSEDIIQNGNVITVEPGIYVEGLGGVRIEDVVAIKDGRAINLTRSEKSLIIL
ncbi:MAG: aminopeptidase P family protein [Clostridiales bacterium]|nr:aminopeptidase P family protein [Clostridiales bacterium]